jgi:hypothetical protein
MAGSEVGSDWHARSHGWKWGRKRLPEAESWLDVEWEVTVSSEVMAGSGVGSGCPGHFFCKRGVADGWTVVRLLFSPHVGERKRGTDHGLVDDSI